MHFLFIILTINFSYQQARLDIAYAASYHAIVVQKLLKKQQGAVPLNRMTCCFSVVCFSDRHTSKAMKTQKLLPVLVICCTRVHRMGQNSFRINTAHVLSLKEHVTQCSGTALVCTGFWKTSIYGTVLAISGCGYTDHTCSY